MFQIDTFFCHVQAGTGTERKRQDEKIKKECSQTYYWIGAELLEVTRNDLTLISGIRSH